MKLETKYWLAHTLTICLFICLTWIAYVLKGPIFKAWLGTACVMLIFHFVCLRLRKLQQDRLKVHWAIGLLLTMFWIIIVFEQPLSSAGKVIGIFFVFAALLERYFHFLNLWLARAEESEAAKLPAFDIIEYFKSEHQKMRREALLHKINHQENERTIAQANSQKKPNRKTRKIFGRRQYRKNRRKTQ